MLLWEHFFNLFWCQQCNFRTRRSKKDPKIGTFGHFDTCVLAILGFKKVDFWTFSKFFKSCVRSIRALFSTLRDQLLGVFSSGKVDKCPPQSKFPIENLVIFAVLSGHFWPFWKSKKSFSRLFQSCFGIV